MSRLMNAAESRDGVAEGGELFMVEGDVPEITGDPWHILITDDDEEVHRATEFALRKADVDGRPLHFIHAYNAAQALELLGARSDIAVAMVDVVMETPDAGLRLVESIRKDLGNTSVRIVLRTGQPGYAPELEVIRRYDINDYRTKSELTQSRLLTTLTAAIRAYAQIEAVQAANRGMVAVSRASQDIFRLRSTRDFAKILMQRLGELLGRQVDGLVCVQHDHEVHAESGLFIEYAGGCYEAAQGEEVSQRLDVEMQRAIQRCLGARSNLVEASRVVIWLGGGGRDAVAVIDLDQSLSELERNLLQMYAANLAIGFENVDMIERLDFFAYHDPLTHLMNRTRFLKEIDQDLFRLPAEPHGLAIIDIVRFSDINDSLGHLSGDSLLVAVGKRLRSVLGPESILARLSADWFGAYGPIGVLDAAKLNAAFRAPFFVHGHALIVRLRMGVVRLDQCKGNALELLRNASLAIRSVHGMGGGCSAFFSSGMLDDARTRISLLHSLRAAIDFKRGLSLVFQPLVSLEGKSVVAAEVMLRWRNDLGEEVVPARFLPLAEQTGMIHELGGWVLQKALEQLAGWRSMGHAQLEVMVNVSPVQLRDGRYVSRALELLRDLEIEPACLCMEVPEAVHREDAAEVRPQLERIRSAGIRLVLDGFGGGEASVPQLAQFAFDDVKMAAGFVAQIAGGEVDRRVAHSLLMFARQCCRRLIVKNVETEEQLRCLQASGCDLVQGYYPGKPLPADQFEQWLGQRGHP